MARLPSRSIAVASRAIPALISFAGILLSLVAFDMAQHADEARARANLEVIAQARAGNIRDKIRVATVPIEALADFIPSQLDLELGEFYRFADQARRDNPIKWLAWAPLVVQGDRARFEQDARQIGIAADYSIHGTGFPGAAVGSEHEQYLPIFLEQGFDDMAPRLGLDLYSDRRRAGLADKARDRGEPVAAPVASTSSPYPDYVVVWPIYSHGLVPGTPAERRQAFSGVVIGELPFDAVMRFAVQNAGPVQATISVFIDPEMGRPFGVPLAVVRPQTGAIERPTGKLAAPAPGALRLTRSFALFGCTWTLVSDFGPEIVGANESFDRWVYLACGLLMTLCVVTYLLREQHRRAAAEAEVADRTRDLRATTSRLQTLIDASPVAIGVFDIYRRVVMWNRKTEELTGYGISEVAGKPLPPSLGEPLDGLADRLDGVVQGRVLHGLEVGGRRKDGSAFHAVMSVAGLFDTDHAFQGLIVAAIDVTERKELEQRERDSLERLRATQTLLSAIVSASDDAMISNTLDGTVTSWNRSAEQIFGYTADEMIGRSIAALAVPGYEEDVLAVLEKIRRGERVDHYETQRRRSDGASVDISLTVSPIRDAGGTIIGASKVVRDITAAKAARLALSASEHKYRTTFDMARVGIIHIDQDCRFLMVNDFFCRLLGFQREELLSMTVFDVTEPEDLVATQNEIAAIRNNLRSSGAVTKRCRTKSGRVVWCEVNYTVERGDADRAWKCISIVHDITARRQAEEHQARLTAQLQQAQRMEALGQLTGGIAHDFNNLLSVILGNLDFLAEKFEPGGDGEGLAKAAIEAAVMGTELVRQLLAFARRQPLAPKLIHLALMLEAAGELLRRTLGRGIALELRLADGLWPVMVDVVQLESALLNLAVNASHAMPTGGTLVIEAKNTTIEEDAAELYPDVSPGDYLAISVSDTGSGMSPETLARVFEPFFTTKGAAGTGLGLSMVHGFVKQSGGHTKIYSELGHGTSVHIYMPRAEDADGREPAVAKPETMPKGHEVILVVEDDKAVREVALRRLDELGYRTISASGGVEALAILRSGGAVDLLFTDMVMPGWLGGRELAAATRRLRPGLRVLFTSGFTAAAASAGMMEEIGVALLTKPYRKQELARRIRALLDSPASAPGDDLEAGEMVDRRSGT